jgi:hypothetical protein
MDTFSALHLVISFEFISIRLMNWFFSNKWNYSILSVYVQLNLFFQSLSFIRSIKVEYSHQGHLLCVAYENILQLTPHGDYEQTMNGRITQKKVEESS